ncbi:hypothetical protein [Acinetobacter variabilis]|uniref:Uncharacterized protein n=2 Tax=Acinetobacter variabilis TaxID=70346 RepID=N9MJL8_9GAMM|nr:hypothetical protein [Acinetobacter variabilis]ENX08834.1 hypothetical protein F897_01985 [Acinetobacter variabilis]UBI30984.1 hypothetical protein LA331_02090 [Acinetobacter variabilis]
MRNKTLTLYLLAGMLLISILAGIAYQVHKDIYKAEFNILKPDDQMTFATKSLITSNLNPKTAVPARTARHPEVDSEQQVLLQQREQLYLDFTQMMNGLSQGEKPDERQLDRLLVQQQNLVNAQVVAPEEARAQIEFLQKVLPKISPQLDQALNALDQKSF